MISYAKEDHIIIAAAAVRLVDEYTKFSGVLSKYHRAIKKISFLPKREIEDKYIVEYIEKAREFKNDKLFK